MPKFIDLSVAVKSNILSPPSINSRAEITPHRHAPFYVPFYKIEETEGSAGSLLR
jgi:hypothetical protein